EALDQAVQGHFGADGELDGCQRCCAGVSNRPARRIPEGHHHPGLGKVGNRPGRVTTNCGHFTAGDFAPSLSFSTQLHMPDGFPQRPPPPEPPAVSSSESGSDNESSSDEDGDGWRDVTSVFPKRNRAVASPLPSSSASTSTSSTPPPSTLPQPEFTNIYDDDDDDDDDPPSDLSTPQRFVFLQQHVAKMKAKHAHLRKQRDEAATYAILAGDHIKTLQGQLNAKKKDKGGQHVVHTQSRILTTAEGRTAAQQQKDARDEKSEKAAQSQIRKDDAAAATRSRRAELGPAGMSFSGALKQQKAPDLKDIAWALALDEVGTREVLIARIGAYFDAPANAALKTDKRYIGLFARKRKRGAAHSDEDEPEPGPSTTPRRRRLNDVTNLPSPSPLPRSTRTSTRTHTAQTETLAGEIPSRSAPAHALPCIPSLWLPKFRSRLSLPSLQSSSRASSLHIHTSHGLIYIHSRSLSLRAPPVAPRIAVITSGVSSMPLLRP
ncbi:hypothetical protein DFH09DRAFT_1452432, partial [Mycena vulgaris]